MTANRSAADAKARIVVYGDAEVIAAIAKFERTGAVLADDDAKTAFVNLVMSMRDSPADVSPTDIQLALVGS